MSLILTYPESQGSLLLERPGSFEYRTLNFLREMGFSRELTLSAIEYTSSYNLDTLLNFMIKGENGWNHDFVPGENNLCKLCFDYAEQHSSYQDPQHPGIKIKLKLRESFILRQKENESKQIKIENPCEVCFGETQEPFKLQSCEEHQICRDCVIKYLEALILEGKVVSIKCPFLDCPSTFTDEDVKLFVDESIYKKLIRFKKNIEINRDSKAKFCSMPDCEGIVRKENDESMQVCDKCQAYMCFECGRPWHPKKNCEELIDKEYERWALGKEVQLCPSCDYKIEKDEGCNHMTCAICGYQFCWLCRGKYTSNHFSNLNPFGCPNMQFGNVRRSRWLYCKICLKRMKICLLWILFILLCPLIILLGPAILLFHEVNKNTSRSMFMMYGKCGASLIFIGISLLSPLIYIVLFIYCFFWCLSSICRYFKYLRRRRDMRMMNFENLF